MPELRIHADRLDDSHPLARKTVTCYVCDNIVHTDTNVCFETWIEGDHHNFCLACSDVYDRLRRYGYCGE